MWPWKKRTEVHASTVPELFSVIRELQDKVDRLEAQHLSLRGRVYALWGKGGSLVETTETPRDQLPLTDPRLTKAELRTRLQASGALTPKKSN